MWVNKTKAFRTGGESYNRFLWMFDWMTLKDDDDADDNSNNNMPESLSAPVQIGGE